MYTYEALKDLANSIRTQYHIKCSVNDLIALAAQNDPFYVGTESDKVTGRWFADLWERFGYMSHIHLRRVHYQIISQETLVFMPNGKPYENTEGCWDFLIQASKAARYLEYVDAESFVDRRNPDPVINAFWGHTPPAIIPYDEQDAALIFPPFPALPSLFIMDYRGQQAYQLEIWCEKSTMNDVLQPLCQRYAANLVTGIGEQSITQTIALVNRAAQNQKPVRIFYVSDFDPAGKSMPVAVARKAEYYIRKLHPELDFRLFPVVLTEEQVRIYQLPRTPIKDSERRKDRFEETYGTGAVELDALEALHPGTLESILREHLDCYYDKTLSSRVWRAEERLRDELDSIQADIYQDYQDEFDALQMEYERIRADFQDRMASYTERQQALWQVIREQLSSMCPDITDYPIPEANEAEEIGEGLFNSLRSYKEQLIAYKEFQGKNGSFTDVARALLSSDGGTEL
jgi:hypothetical protein